MKNFDAVEVHPCRSATADPTDTGLVEQCEESDEDILYWTVFGHTTGLGLDCICDCPSRELAEMVADAVAAHLKIRR